MINEKDMMSVRLDYQNTREYTKIIQWCMIEFSVDSERWKYFRDEYRNHELVMYFRDESDAVACKLRWI